MLDTENLLGKMCIPEGLVLIHLITVDDPAYYGRIHTCVIGVLRIGENVEPAAGPWPGVAGYKWTCVTQSEWSCI